MPKVKVFGNLNNRIMETTENMPKPTPGMGVTMTLFSDRKAGTVVCLVDEAYVIVQADNVVRTDKNGMSDSQSYEYSRDLNGSVYTFKRFKDGSWREVTMNSKSNRLVQVSGGMRAIFGVRKAYHDFGF